MKRCTLFLLALLPLSAIGQTAAVNGFCNQGGTPALTQGMSSTNKLQGITPSCIVTVYLTGTSTAAAIFKDSIGTVLGNPFTASANGQYLFYAATGVGLDVVKSSGTTDTDVVPGGGGGTPGGTNGSLQINNNGAFGGTSGVLNAGVFAGADLGAQINAAYAALPASGGNILIPAGNFNVSTPIVIGTTKQAYLTCLAGSSSAAGGDSVLTWTPSSGTMLTLNARGTNLSGCVLNGPGGTNTAIGVVLGGSNTDIFGDMRDTYIAGFHVGLEILSNTYIDTFDNVNVANNDTNILIPSGVGDMGENFSFTGGSFAMNGGPSAVFSKTCVNIMHGSELHFNSVSFDQCGIDMNADQVQVTLTAPHFEDSSNGGSIPFVTMDTACQQCSLNSYGGLWLEDIASARASFISVASTVSNTALAVNLFGGQFIPGEALTQIALDSSACCASGSS